MGTWSLLYCSIFVNVNFFFPHNRLKKKSWDVILSLSGVLPVESCDCGLCVQGGMCTYADKEGWKARAVRGCVSFPGLLYSVLQTRGLKTTEIYSPEILKASRSELEVSAASLWAARGESFLAVSSWQSLGFQAARLHHSHLCLCEHVAISLPLFKWSSLCVSPALFSQLPGTHPKGSVTSSWLDHLCKDPISRKATFSGSRG